MRLRFLLLLLLPLLALLFAACAQTPIPANTGIEGHVVIGPTCPVMQINNPCPDKPYQTALTVLTMDQRKVAQFQTDANGYFRVALAPGQYILHPESPNALPRASDIPFTVKADVFTQMNVSYDSGIR